MGCQNLTAHFCRKLDKADAERALLDSFYSI